MPAVVLACKTVTPSVSRKLHDTGEDPILVIAKRRLSSGSTKKEDL